MDSILGIGLPELIVVLLLAGLVMGPHRIRQVARTLGRYTAQLQGISRQFARQLNAELDSLDDGELKGSLQDWRALQEEVESLRREISEGPRSIMQEGRAAMEDGQKALQGNPAGEATGKVPLPVPTLGDGSQSDKRDDSLPKLLEIPDDPE